ncbi:MAG: methyltransferase domain-containing protein [Caldilineaceae bacterium]
MATSTQWQLAQDAAERYQRVLTPYILGPFAEKLVEFADLRPGERVVDVGCGTGAAARHAAQIVGESGSVVGIDVNHGMLAVAEALPAVRGATVEWREANATALPFDNASVDAVLCAQTLQFLPDKAAALSEMARAVKRNGRVAVSFWSDIGESPYFNALVRAIDTHIGAEVAAGLRSAFGLADADVASALFRNAGFRRVEMSQARLDLPLPTLTDFVPRHISATPMSIGFQSASQDIQTRLVQSVCEELAFDGAETPSIPFTSHLALACL